jgi:hypothetical protein
VAKIHKPKETFLDEKWAKEFDITSTLTGVIVISIVLAIAFVILGALLFPFFNALVRANPQIKATLILFYILVFVFPVITGIYIPFRLRMLTKKNIKTLKEIGKASKTEKEVEKILKNLSDEYSVYMNVFLGYGDIDAVVIGPTGVFAVEAKYNNGFIAQDSKGHISVIEGIDPKKDYRRQAIGESSQLKKYLDKETGEKTWVFPILVFPVASVMKGIVLENKNDNYKVPVLGKEELIQYIYQHEKEYDIKKIEMCKKTMDKFAGM